MNIIWTSFRIYLIWFLLIHAAAIVVLLKTDYSGGVFMDLVGITPSISLPSHP